MPKKIFFSALAIVVALTFSGCGAPSSGGTDSGKESKEKVTGKSGMEDVCNYFPKELVEEAIGRPIVRVEDTSIAEDHLCDYFTDWSETYDHTPYGDKPGGAMVVVVFEDDSSVTASKAEFDKYGYTYKKDDSLPVDNLMVYSRGAKTPYRVDLIVSENKFFRINTIHSAVTDEEIVKIGKRFAERMASGK